MGGGTAKAAVRSEGSRSVCRPGGDQSLDERLRVCFPAQKMMLETVQDMMYF